jgi:amino-acid N-acetyltransferase
MDRDKKESSKKIATKKSSPKKGKTAAASKNSNKEFVSQFRGAAPYIHAHRGRTFVITFSGEMVESSNFHELIHDIALLNSLGVRLILIHGARPQIETRLKEFNLDSQIVNGLRVTYDDTLLCVKEAIGTIRLEIEGFLSSCLPNSPMAGAEIRVASGNFVTAKPLGVRNGVDYQHTGEVRRIEIAAVENLLDSGFIVLLSPIGTSPTGEIFNLSSEDVATSAAIQLNVDKMISLIDKSGVVDGRKKLIRQLTPDAGDKILKSRRKLPEQIVRHLISAIHACREGVPRSHIISSRESGSLLQELFTRDGIGTMVSSDSYDEIRSAEIEDIGGIISLIQPLEESGILVPRSREQLEIEINHFIVMERDGMIIGVVALYPYPEQGLAEIAALVIHPNYQNSGRGEELLEFLENQLQNSTDISIKKLFLLSTHTSHWFQERGYIPAKLADLPLKRQSLYNFKRNSKVFIKDTDEKNSTNKIDSK